MKALLYIGHQGVNFLCIFFDGDSETMAQK